MVTFYRSKTGRWSRSTFTLGDRWSWQLVCLIMPPTASSIHRWVVCRTSPYYRHVIQRFWFGFVIRSPAGLLLYRWTVLPYTHTSDYETDRRRPVKSTYQVAWSWVLREKLTHSYISLIPPLIFTWVKKCKIWPRFLTTQLPSRHPGCETQ